MVRLQIVNKTSAKVPNYRGDQGDRGAREDTRLLPTWYSANYVSLLPGETKHVTVECCSTQAEESGGDGNGAGAAASSAGDRPAADHVRSAADHVRWLVGQGLALQVDGFNVAPLTVDIQPPP